MAEPLRLKLRWKETYLTVAPSFDKDGDLELSVEEDESDGVVYFTPTEAAALRDHLTEVLASGSIQ